MVVASQPLESSPSQLCHPEAHAPILQVPDEQMAVACSKLQRLPHAPQFAVSLCVSTQIPLHAVHPGVHHSAVAVKSWPTTSAPLTVTDRLTGAKVKLVGEGVTV